MKNQTLSINSALFRSGRSPKSGVKHIRSLDKGREKRNGKEPLNAKVSAGQSVVWEFQKVYFLKQHENTCVDVLKNTIIGVLAGQFLYNFNIYVVVKNYTF